jgi:cephalosporin-C deacetylase-like acetyl esterase
VGNDHFNDGVRCYLTGTTSQRFSLIDALRAIDYLATRPDVDMKHGVGMSGVSGGGITTAYCTLLDDRIKAAAPSCFASPEAYNPLRNGYAQCPETMPIGRYRKGIQTIDLLVGAYPTPLLLMAGNHDELFRSDWSQAVAEEVARAYDAGGRRDRFDFYVDDSPHGYTSSQALRAVRWMDRWVPEIPERVLAPIRAEDLEMAPDEVLQCHPRAEENIYSINRREAERLATLRTGVPIRTAAMRLAGLDEKALQQLKPLNVKSAEPFMELHYDSLQELLLASDAGTQLPATMLYEANPKTRAAAILYFDDRGRWADLGSAGMLVGMSNMLTKAGLKVAILTEDLRGWGDTHPSYAPYEVYGWGSSQRWLAYVSVALDDPVLAMRIRDGLTALAYLRSRSETDPEQIVVGGHGMGGLVALHVAEIDGHVRGVFCHEILSSFQTLAESPSYAWEHDVFFPNVLRYYDVPELAADLRVPLLIVNPLDAMKRPLLPVAARQLYSQALARGNVDVQTGLTGLQAQTIQINWTNHLWQSAVSVR